MNSCVPVEALVRIIGGPFVAELVRKIIQNEMEYQLTILGKGVYRNIGRYLMEGVAFSKSVLKFWSFLMVPGVEVTFAW